MRRGGLLVLNGAPARRSFGNQSRKRVGERALRLRIRLLRCNGCRGRGRAWCESRFEEWIKARGDSTSGDGGDATFVALMSRLFPFPLPFPVRTGSEIVPLEPLFRIASHSVTGSIERRRFGYVEPGERRGAGRAPGGGEIVNEGGGETGGRGAAGEARRCGGSDHHRGAARSMVHETGARRRSVGRTGAVDRRRALTVAESLRCAARRDSSIVRADYDQRMIRAHRAGSHFERALAMTNLFVEVPARAIDLGKRFERCRDCEIVRQLQLLANLQRATCERFAAVVVLLMQADLREARQDRRDLRMARAECLLLDREQSLEQRACGRVLVPAEIQSRKIVQRDCNVGMRLAGCCWLMPSAR